MPYSLVYSLRAARQPAAFKRYLTDRFSAAAAVVFIDRIKARWLKLAPFQGTRRDELRPELRTTGMEGILTIGYRVDGSVIRVILIAYRGQDLQSVLHRQPR